MLFLSKYLLETGTLPTLPDNMVWLMLYFIPKVDLPRENPPGGTLGVRKDRLVRCGETSDSLEGKT